MCTVPNLTTLPRCQHSKKPDYCGGTRQMAYAVAEQELMTLHGAQAQLDAIAGSSAPPSSSALMEEEGEGEGEEEEQEEEQEAVSGPSATSLSFGSSRVQYRPTLEDRVLTPPVSPIRLSPQLSPALCSRSPWRGCFK